MAPLLDAFTGSNLRSVADPAAILGTLCVDGDFVALRMRLSPRLECYLSMPSLDGFELAVGVKERWLLAEGVTKVKSNDAGAESFWCDQLIVDAHDAQVHRHNNERAAREDWRAFKRAALAALEDTTARRTEVQPAGGDAWALELNDQHVLIRPLCADFLQRDVIDAVQLAAMHATRPHRIARELLARIKQLGFEVSHAVDRIAFAAPAVTIEVATVQIDIELRRTPLTENVDHALHWLLRGTPLPSMGGEPDLKAIRRSFKNADVVFEFTNSVLLAALPCNPDGWITNELLGQVAIAMANICRGAVASGPYR